MGDILNSSGFETSDANAVTPTNASVSELLPQQSHGSIVSKIRINDKWLLLKRIHPDFRRHSLYINALEKEFSLGFGLDHPHIVKYLNKGEDSEGPYLIAEYIDGYPLRHKINQNPAGINDIKLIDKIILQLIDALGYLHERQIFHLDLKPDNILITNKGLNVKIIDFGMSGADCYVAVPAGTKEYCAPEQLKNPELADARSDIYGLGIILLELFTGSSSKSGIKKIPARYKKTVIKCIEIQQEKRFQSVLDVKKELHNKSRHKIWQAVLLVALVFFIGFILTVFIQSEKPSGSTNMAAPEQYTEFTGNITLSDKEKVYNDIIGYSALMENSKSILESLNRVHKIMLSAPLLAGDSIKVCELAKNIFPEFLNQVSEYDKNPSSRSRKLVLTEIKEKCVLDFENRLNSYLAQYDKGSSSYMKLLEIYKIHANVSEDSIDKYIFTPK